MQMQSWLLEKTMHVIIGKDVFGTIQKLVRDVSENNTMTGAEKREKVVEALSSLAITLGMSLLNLAIEAAVVVLKSKLTK